MPDRWSWPSGSGNFWALCLHRPAARSSALSASSRWRIPTSRPFRSETTMVRTPRLCIRSTKGSSDSLGRIVVGPISMASSAVASGALLQRLAAQATLDDPPRQRRPRPDLIEQGLIDVYELWIDPLVLRTGKRLFREGAQKTALKLG